MMADSSPKPPVPQSITLELPASIEAKYVNMVRIVHSPSELVLDFAQILPGDSHAKIQSRILLSPFSAKLFLRALIDNISKYEATFGEVVVPGETSLAERLFRSGNSTEGS